MVIVHGSALLFVTRVVPTGRDDGWQVGLMLPTKAEGQYFSQRSESDQVVAFGSKRYFACNVYPEDT